MDGRARRIVVVGSKSICLRVLRTVLGVGAVVSGVITIDDGSDTRSRFADLVATAELNSIPVALAARRQDADEAWRELDPSLVIVAGWYWLIHPGLLEGRTVVGFHNSLLPRYRGGAPLVWAMIAGERQVGVSMFELDAGMDSGPLWGQAVVGVGPDDYVGDVLPRIEDASERLLGLRLPDLLAGEGRPVAQTGEPTYCAQRHSEDGRIDWTRPADRVRDFIRAQSSPYPGAFTERAGKRVTIWRADVGPAALGAPGHVIGGAIVCGDRRTIVPLATAIEKSDAGQVHTGAR